MPGFMGADDSERILGDKTVGYENSRLPVVDISKFIPGKHDLNTIDFRIVICDFNQQLYGLLVDSAVEITRVEPANIGPAENIPDGMESSLVTGIINEENRKIYILSPDRLLSKIQINQPT
jgi:chemotaxis signal transduction protein